jgi:hypothetical protein
MLMANHLIGFGVVEDGISLTLQDSTAQDDPVDGVFTFEDVNFGAAQLDRVIIIVFGVIDLVDTTEGITSVTIGGVSATVNVHNIDVDAFNVQAAIATAAVPSGTTGDVVVEMDSNINGHARVAVYRATGILSSTPSATTSNDDDVVSMSIDTLAGGFVIAGAMFRDSGAVTSVGINEDVDEAVTVSGQFAVGSASRLSAETGRTISFDGPAGAAAGVAAAFR